LTMVSTGGSGLQPCADTPVGNTVAEFSCAATRHMPVLNITDLPSARNTLAHNFYFTKNT
jgi:hypothetical protein